jgi:hypothetical protein
MVKDLYLPKKFYHSGALIITAPCDREYSMWKLTIALSCLPVATAYLYQYDLWARQRRAARQERRSHNSTSPTSDPVEPQVKPAFQAAPEVSHWYVFRSGKAEGSSSKLQLWEVQKITDRTKVRRGKSDRQAAGEIPELAKYLTEY